MRRPWQSASCERAVHKINGAGLLLNTKLNSVYNFIAHCTTPNDNTMHNAHCALKRAHKRNPFSLALKLVAHIFKLSKSREFVILYPLERLHKYSLPVSWCTDINTFVWAQHCDCDRWSQLASIICAQQFYFYAWQHCKLRSADDWVQLLGR